MKKIVLLLIVLIGIFSINCIHVDASVINSSKKFDNNVEINYLADQSSDVSCEGLITEEGLDMIREVLNWIRIITPILLILLIAIDLSSAAISQDNDALSKATKKIVPRLIATALLFFVPTIIRAILGMDGIRSEIVIPNDPLCGVASGK